MHGLFLQFSFWFLFLWHLHSIFDVLYYKKCNFLGAEKNQIPAPIGGISMKQETSQRIRRIYGFILSICLIVTGVLLTVACWGIYNSGGEQIYTPDKVSAAFVPIAPAVYVCLALIAGSILLQVILPAELKKGKVEKNPLLLLQRLQKSRTVDETTRQQLKALQRKGSIPVVISIVLLVLSTIGCSIYAVTTTHFDHVKTMAAAIRPMLVTVLFMVLPMVCSIFAAYRYRKVLQQQVELWKQKGTPVVTTQASSCNQGIRIVRWSILCVAVILIIAGFALGGWQDVLTKAVNICTECVGLG